METQKIFNKTLLRMSKGNKTYCSFNEIRRLKKSVWWWQGSYYKGQICYLESKTLLQQAAERIAIKLRNSVCNNFFLSTKSIFTISRWIQWIQYNVNTTLRHPSSQICCSGSLLYGRYYICIKWYNIYTYKQ